ncbi:hypothetical protein A2331_01045 [Candidatus Falkowbacteria bacterium RIFOXYB2_FULL_34_18]|uniref:Uncharacterized protein n=1 Tax=Candidatus Falkowbacteria bacterium RIFOXYD2_FULL_34_120 TaxID=1798007 RepID=A0A1F5TSJ5_9BACT|nr:MAG: hypothetical protein A2331_01045 [Candidatus Falkowbacteria bacterium RIFOXYB2_FULL_34_18]OGF30167.1 MAG: hypothetical protein A2500_02065 [Candidatus Falkowbacteria bacterium RIFOXYC12_FULL_34_55]OGF37684.1 MAG: hypothetical protein A2466_05600 [Candidatus Falkowbacteria bacterium RIFOXYC2_FULL_34_220]OGF39411.1 MAG: hypothetical protein A2515_02830 [Candidatus Falkowbacteria bacterium RIFOXYD12_FULL_34_57]OGF41940.1 MAG: hypothetical protein A2531_04895 [Candidatus Falkowbacteria bact
MSVAKIKKINIIAHNDSKKEILEFLFDRGFMEILPAKDASAILVRERRNDEATNTEYKLSKITYALDFLSSYHQDTRTLTEKINQEKKNIYLDEIFKLQNDFKYFEVCEKIEDCGQGFNTLKSLIIKLNEEKKKLLPWKNLPLTENDIETKNVKVVLGSIANDKYDEFCNKINKKFTKINITRVEQNDSCSFVYIIFIKEYERRFFNFLNNNSFKLIESPLGNISVRERIDEIDKEIEGVETEIGKIKSEVQEIANKHFENLQIIFDFLTWQLKQENIQENFEFTENTFSVLGWIKNTELSELKKGIQKITDFFDIIELKIKEDEPVPIIMKNSKLVTPFEFVTSIYGFPRYGEVDPTPFLAGFFIIFFGLCLTDAGYGIILTICSFIFLKFFKFTGGTKKLLQVLFFGGIVTFIAGGLTGGWFGVVLDDLPESLAWLAKPLIAIRQVDPVKDPLTILALSILLGYIHLVFGNFISLSCKIKQGEVKDGLLTSGVWIYFLLTIGFWIATIKGVLPPSVNQAALYAVISAIILVVLTQGKSKNPIMKIFGGLTQLYFGISGYVSDILSYSRLLALGLATGIIGMVVNIVGAMVYDKIPYIGWLLMVLVLIGGHLMNLVISLVGAFVHSGRLQYVEFFKTFFEGGGRIFHPFIRENKYINLIKK